MEEFTICENCGQTYKQYDGMVQCSDCEYTETGETTNVE